MSALEQFAKHLREFAEDVKRRLAAARAGAAEREAQLVEPVQRLVERMADYLGLPVTAVG